MRTLSVHTFIHRRTQHQYAFVYKKWVPHTNMCKYVLFGCNMWVQTQKNNSTYNYMCQFLADHEKKLF